MRVMAIGICTAAQTCHSSCQGCPVLRDGSVNLEVGEICDDGNRLRWV